MWPKNDLTIIIFLSCLEKWFNGFWGQSSFPYRSESTTIFLYKARSSGLRVSRTSLITQGKFLWQTNYLTFPSCSSNPEAKLESGTLWCGENNNHSSILALFCEARVIDGWWGLVNWMKRNFVQTSHASKFLRQHSGELPVQKKSTHENGPYISLVGGSRKKLSRVKDKRRIIKLHIKQHPQKQPLFPAIAPEPVWWQRLFQ